MFRICQCYYWFLGGAKKEIGTVRNSCTNSSLSCKKQPQICSNNNITPELTTECTQIVSLRKSHPTLKWSNGWSWEGTPFKSKVFITVSNINNFVCIINYFKFVNNSIS